MSSKDIGWRTSERSETQRQPQNGGQLRRTQVRNARSPQGHSRRESDRDSPTRQPEDGGQHAVREHFQERGQRHQQSQLRPHDPKPRRPIVNCHRRGHGLHCKGHSAEGAGASCDVIGSVCNDVDD